MIETGLDQAEPVARTVALGSFDGVHLGHRRVIEGAIAAAAERGTRSSVVTFEPHPIVVLRPELAPHELSTPQRRSQLVAELGPDELIVIRFDHAFSQIEHDQFAERVLHEKLDARLVIVGRNYRYGHRAQGSIETLAASGQRLGFDVQPAPLLELDGAPVSSSRIRDLFSAGEVEHAARLLGRAPWLEGTIVRGDGRGRELGFATANLESAPRSAMPAIGIYAGRAHLPGESFAAAISVGYNPTFSDERERVRVEAHLLDFDRDIYGQPLRIEFMRRLRGEQRFGTVDGSGRPGAPRHRRRPRRAAGLATARVIREVPAAPLSYHRAYRLRTASGCGPPASTRKARPPSASLTASASSVPRNTSPTPSSAAKPAGSTPSATHRSYVGFRSTSPS